MFQPDLQAITHNQHHKGEGSVGGYSRALQSVQPPTKQQRDGHQPLKRAPEHPLGHWASILPPAVMVSMTSEPESDDVTKKMTIKASDIGATTL